MARVLRRRVCIAIVAALGFVLPGAAVARRRRSQRERLDDAHRPGDGPRVRGGLVRSTARCTSTPAATPAPSTRSLLGLLSGLAPGQSPVIRIGGDSTDGTAGGRSAGMIPPGRHLLPPHQGLAAHHPGAGRRPERQADPRHQPRRRAAGDRRRRGPRVHGGDRAQVHRRLRDRQRARPVPGVPLVQGPPRPHLSGPRARLRPQRRTPSSSPSGRGRCPTCRWPARRSRGPSWMGKPGVLHRYRASLGLVTYHRYPLRACVTDPASPGFPSIPNLLADSSSAGLAAADGTVRQCRPPPQPPVPVAEMNSASCQGAKGVSDTFASALWALDTMFNFASVGVDGVNFHMLPGSNYELFTVSHRQHRRLAGVRPSRVLRPAHVRPGVPARGAAAQRSRRRPAR